MKNRTPRLGKQNILEVAENLFTEHGFQSVSIRDIARASGVTNAALYYHFTSKEALFDEVIEHHVEKLAHHMEKAGSQASDTRGKLIAILGEYGKQVSDRRSPIFSLRPKPVIAHTEHAQKQHTRHVKRMLAPIELTLQNAIDQGELRQLPNAYSPASLLLGLFHGMLLHLKHSNQIKISKEDIELVIDIFWFGMKL